MKTINIGLIGYGTVGKGVYNIIYNNLNLYKKMGLKINIPYICVNNLNKQRDFNKFIKWDTPIITNKYENIINNKNIDVVVEVMGGIETPLEIFNKTLKNNKYFITANKNLIATHLQKITDDLIIHEKNIGIEACVAGGIPIIKTLQKQYLSDNITSLTGIINGTTNYILTHMTKNNKKYLEVLEEAQKKGFAELDPTSDIKGYDARAKLSILSYLAYGNIINENNIYTVGIDNISNEDLNYAKILKCSIKHLAISKINEENELNTYVMPTLISNKDILSSIDYEENIINIDSKYNNNCKLIGKGAGMYPTGISVVNDILDIVTNDYKNILSKKYSPKYKYNFKSCFMIRINITKNDIYTVNDIIHDIENEFKKNKIIISRLPYVKNDLYDTIGYITEETNIKDIELLFKTLKNYKFYKDSNIFNVIKN
jgi:homoserine dehydrogenase